MAGDRRTHESDSAIAPELEALLWCLRLRLADPSERSPAFGSTFDWPGFLRLADQHRVLPIAYSALTGNWQGPPSEFERLRAEAIGVSLRSAALAREAVRLSALIETAGIPVIVTKGPILGSLAYGNPALRQFGDIDLLVRPDDAYAAAEALLADGYEAHSRDGLRDIERLSARQEQFVKPGRPGFVELHWRLMPSFFDYGPDEKAIWGRASRVPLMDGHVLTLCDRDTTLFLCAHGAKHGWPALQLVGDVAAMIQRGIDWDATIAEARAAGSIPILMLGVRLAQDVLGCDLPAEISRMAAADRAVGASVERVKARLFSSKPNLTLLGEAIFQFGMTRGFRGRIRYLSERGLNATVNDRNFLRLPRRLDRLYVVIRPLRVILQALKAIGPSNRVEGSM